MTYELNKIYCADCYEAIKQIPDKSVDLIYTDIPYDVEDITAVEVALERRSEIITANTSEFAKIQTVRKKPKTL